MATLTIRNVPENVVELLKVRAKNNGHSMEQEVRELIERSVDRRWVLDQIEKSWARQTRRPTAEEIDRAIEEGRDFGKVDQIRTGGLRQPVR